MKKIQLLLLLLLMGCQELLTVPNISYEKVVFLQPKNDTTFNSSAVQFRWEQIENASHYRFQLIHLEDTSSQRILRDTLLDTNQFRDSLEINGRYWWRVKAENSGYSTSYTEGEFTVNTPHITNYEITLISPKGASDITELTPLFSWDGPLEIEHYRFQLAQPDFDSAFQLLVDTLTVNKNLRVLLTESGAYAWRVRGENQNGNSAFTQSKFNLINPLLEQEVNLIYPAEEAVLNNLTTRFEWDALEHADHYRFQLATPDFISVNQILLDTLVSVNKITTTLPNEKQFQWRVRGENENGYSAFTQRSFNWINPLLEQQVNLVYPVEEAELSNLTTRFEWDTLEHADHYRFQLATPDFISANQILLDTLVSVNKITTTLPNEKQFQWRVRGENQNGYSVFTLRSFNWINPLLEQQVNLIYPVEEAELSNLTTRFEWDTLEHADHYRFQLATPDFISANQILLDTLVSENKITTTFPNEKQFQWRVRGEDKLDVTEYSSRSFTRIDPLEQWMISLNFPQSEQRLSNLNVFFQWEAAPLAENYQLQIVRPNFDAIEEYILDSIVEQNNFQTSLEDNQQYSWRVRGLSTTASTAFSSSTFSIATQSDLTNQQLLFLAPASNSVLSTTNVNFNWEALTDVDYYHIQIATPSFNNALQILVDQQTTSPNITASLSSSATYEWRVRAHNSHSSTNYTSANFTIK